MLYDEAMGGEVTDRKKAKKRHLTEGMTQETLTDLTVLVPWSSTVQSPKLRQRFSRHPHSTLPGWAGGDNQ